MEAEIRHHFVVQLSLKSGGESLFLRENCDGITQNHTSSKHKIFQLSLTCFIGIDNLYLCCTKVIIRFLTNSTTEVIAPAPS